MTRLELKICENCGITYTRPIGDVVPYCPRCRAVLRTVLDAAREGIAPEAEATP